MEDLFQKFKKQFIEEIAGLLEQLEPDLLALEKDPENRSLIDSIFRAMHTIKGTSGMYGCKNMSDFTHNLESIFQSIRDGKSRTSREIIDVSLTSLDHIRKLIDDENLTNEDNQQRHKQLSAEISQYVKQSAEGETNFAPTAVSHEIDSDIKTQTWYILVRTDEQIFFRGVSLVNILSDLACIGTYHIHRISSLSDKDTETWGIVLISGSSLNDIKEVFMFIEDNCSFVLIQEGDILNPEEPSTEIIQAAGINSDLSAKTESAAQENIVTLPNPEEVLTAEVASKDEKRIKTPLLTANLDKHHLKRISVDSSKLDYLMYLVSELITLNSQLLQNTKDDYYEHIRPQIEQMESLAKLFRNNALEIRLVPLGDMVVRFQRLVRDLSKQLGKKVEFVTHGTDTELDKNTIDLIADPIIHIIRNCVDHGIESPADRIKKGKNESGTVKLSAHHVGNYIHIKIEDDGSGLNLNRIKEKAIEKGLIRKGDSLTKSEITNLIFHSGFSTSDQITAVSGRGVGMDVVKKKITELRGEILLDTEEGKGTCFTLKIQQSVAIIDTLLFRVQNSYFILPLTEIQICIHSEKSLLLASQTTGTIEYNDMMIPFLDLRSFYHLGGTYPDLVKTLIIREEDRFFALLSDEILGEQQAVLKPMGHAFENDTGILAVSQHGDGKWAYMLNTHFLYQKIKEKTTGINSSTFI